MTTKRERPQKLLVIRNFHQSLILNQSRFNILSKGNNIKERLIIWNEFESCQVFIKKWGVTILYTRFTSRRKPYYNLGSSLFLWVIFGSTILGNHKLQTPACFTLFSLSSINEYIGIIPAKLQISSEKSPYPNLIYLIFKYL